MRSITIDFLCLTESIIIIIIIIIIRCTYVYLNSFEKHRIDDS